jgi:hypothetical protein
VFPLGLLSAQNSTVGEGSNPHGGTSSDAVAKTNIFSSDTHVLPAIKRKATFQLEISKIQLQENDIEK